MITLTPHNGSIKIRVAIPYIVWYRRNEQDTFTYIKIAHEPADWAVIEGVSTIDMLIAQHYDG